MSIDKIKLHYDMLIGRINDLKRQAQDSGTQLLAELTNDFFAKHGAIVDNIYWVQFTPYFNDGEACEFRVGDVFITLHGDDNVYEDEGSVLPTAEDVTQLERSIELTKLWQQHPSVAIERYRQFSKQHYGYDPFEKRGYYSLYNESNAVSLWNYNEESVEALEQRLQLYKNILNNHPDLYTDFKILADTIASIDEDIMKTIFGEHVKIIVSESSTHIEEYQHE